MAGPGLLAYVVTSKYADYLPLYRLENIFARNGFEIDRVTQCIWCKTWPGSCGRSTTEWCSACSAAMSSTPTKR